MVVLGWLFGIAVAAAVIAVAVLFLNRFYRKSTRDIALVRTGFGVAFRYQIDRHVGDRRGIATRIGEDEIDLAAENSAGGIHLARGQHRARLTPVSYTHLTLPTKA